VAKGEFREAVSANVVRILRDERKKRAISMDTLASRAGLSQAMISFVERDLRNPTLDTLLRITEVLEVDLSEVIAQATREATRRKRNA
jgi:transcriptional regulator with XRE-family HTH domain